MYIEIKYYNFVKVFGFLKRLIANVKMACGGALLLVTIQATGLHLH